MVSKITKVIGMFGISKAGQGVLTDPGMGDFLNCKEDRRI